MGLIRDSSDDYIDSLSNEEVKARLEQLNEHTQDNTTPNACRMRLKKISRQRTLKVWHDHSAIAGYGHLLVLVSCVYDPAFYYTQEELQASGLSVDIQSIVEEPEIHILGRSKSSLRDQRMFSQSRVDSLQELSSNISTSTG